MIRIGIDVGGTNTDAVIMNGPEVIAGVKSATAVVLLGLLPTAFAMALYVWLIQRSGAVFVSFTTYLSPLWATFLGVTFLSEPLHWSMIGALALILAGVAVANRLPRRS